MLTAASSRVAIPLRHFTQQVHKSLLKIVFSLAFKKP
jgi:hypothetical protein